MVDFICMDLLDLCEERNRELQNEKLMPTLGFEHGTFRIRFVDCC